MHGVTAAADRCADRVSTSKRSLGTMSGTARHRRQRVCLAGIADDAPRRLRRSNGILVWFALR